MAISRKEAVARGLGAAVGAAVGLAVTIRMVRRLQPACEAFIAQATYPLPGNSDLTLKIKVLDLYWEGVNKGDWHTWQEFAKALRESSDPLAKDFVRRFGPQQVVVTSWWRGTRQYVEINPYWDTMDVLGQHTINSLIDAHRSKWQIARFRFFRNGLPSLLVGSMCGLGAGSAVYGAASAA